MRGLLLRLPLLFLAGCQSAYIDGIAYDHPDPITIADGEQLVVIEVEDADRSYRLNDLLCSITAHATAQSFPCGVLRQGYARDDYGAPVEPGAILLVVEPDAIGGLFLDPSHIEDEPTTVELFIDDDSRFADEYDLERVFEATVELQ